MLHPRLADAILKVLAAMKALGYPMKVVQGVRTTEQQVALFAQGRTKPGPIVTYANGVATKSNHQLKDDGYGHAVDCAFLIEGKPSWDISLPWHAYGACGKALGLKWGGDWKRLCDLPHLELE